MTSKFLDTRAYKAHYVLPIEGPPIENGVVCVCGDRIVDSGRANAVPVTHAVDLGDVAILPCLVNAHAHLEFSKLCSPLLPPGGSFADWIRAVLDFRRKADPTDADERDRSEFLGLDECARSGTAVVGEIATSQWPERHVTSPVEATVFREIICTDSAGNDDAMGVAQNHVYRPTNSSWWRPGLSPHAPYTTNPRLITRLARLSGKTKTPLAMHLAETWEELELLSSHSGPLMELLMELNAWNPASVPRGIQSMDYLELLSEAHRVLVIHGNYLTSDELNWMASHSEKFCLVYCPRTHDYFGHAKYPLAEMLDKGVPVALGTDSRASNPDLSMLDEVRFVAARYPEVSAENVLRLATLGGATALDRESDYGSLVVGKRADLLAVTLPRANVADPFDAIIQQDAKIRAHIRGGIPIECGFPLDSYDPRASC